MRRIIQTISLLLALPSTAENSLESQINRLILALGKSNCQFIRNNKVYTPEESVVHIKKKYNYYRDEIESIDKFIELSASRSLISGKVYQVACAGAEPQASSKWLRLKASELGFNQ